MSWNGKWRARKAGGAGPDGSRWSAGWVRSPWSCAALAKRDTADVEAFFGGGALLLIAGIAAAAVWFRSLAARAASRPLTLTSLGVRGCARQRQRSLAIVALLASGSFLIVAVEANKLDATRDSARRSSGTGGFAFVGESALPIVQDLNTKAGREFFGWMKAACKARGGSVARA